MPVKHRGFPRRRSTAISNRLQTARPSGGEAVRVLIADRLQNTGPRARCEREYRSSLHAATAWPRGISSILVSKSNLEERERSGRVAADRAHGRIDAVDTRFPRF